MRPATRPRFGLRRDEAGAEEILGYILTFAISALVLVTSMNAFHTSKQQSEHVVAATQLKEISDRVANRIVQSVVFAQSNNLNATFGVSVPIPSSIYGEVYCVKAVQPAPGSGDPMKIVAATRSGSASASATTFGVEAGKSTITITGEVCSSAQSIWIRYGLGEKGHPEVKLQPR